MSRQGPNRDKLPLPSPRSPQELDQRIMAHARASAPTANRAGPLVWGGGLATAAILVVAVYLTNLTATNDPAAPAQAPAVKEALILHDEAVSPAPEEVRPRANSGAEESYALDHADTDAVQAPIAAAKTRTAPATVMAARPIKAEADGPAMGPAISTRLARIRAVLQQGKEEQARLEYAELRDSCDCGLPQSLEQALEAISTPPDGQR